jgi:hypothetical protein
MHQLAHASLLLCLVSTLPAAWSPPNEAQLARLDRALARSEARYDPAEQMLRRPFSSPGYHTTLTGGFVHPTRDSLAHALQLLDTGRPADLTRALAIIRRVVALQDTNPASRTYGIWSWFLEEPLEKMSPPDWNWADFNGVILLQIARDHRTRLPADLSRAVDDAILHACRAIKKRNVGPGYTNIAVMGAYVTLTAGEYYHLEEFKTYGFDRLKRFYDYTLENGSFEEYNSPTYTVVALRELSRLQAHVQNPEAQKMLEVLVRRAWEEIAKHFHAPTRQWAGPHSRAYSSLNRASTLALIQRATAGRVNFGADEPDVEELRLPLACPSELEHLFGPLRESRTVTETFIKRTNTVGTTYLHPQFALGTVNHDDLWNQRRPLLLHFGTATAPGYMQLRFLKNGYDFASAMFSGAQRESLVLGAVTLVTDGGDTHVSIDRLKNGKIRARDLRLRFEFGGPAADAVKIDADPKTATAGIQAAGLRLDLGISCARFGSRPGELRSGGDGNRRWADVVFYAGEEKEFDLSALEEAIVGFVFSVGGHGRVQSRIEAGELRMNCDELTVAARTKPATRKERAEFTAKAPSR